MNLLKYNFTFETLAESQKVESQCNAISFKNQGTATVNIHGVEIAEGETFTLSGQGFEVDTTTYTVNFGSTGSKNLVIIRKNYRTT
jgi:hypothetical protein